MRYTASYLKSLPTINQGHFDNLKIETESKRVWLSRCTVVDGEPYNDKITVEKLRGGCWEIVDVYPG